MCRCAGGQSPCGPVTDQRARFAGTPSIAWVAASRPDPSAITTLRPGLYAPWPRLFPPREPQPYSSTNADGQGLGPWPLSHDVAKHALSVGCQQVLETIRRRPFQNAAVNVWQGVMFDDRRACSGCTRMHAVWNGKGASAGKPGRAAISQGCTGDRLHDARSSRLARHVPLGPVPRDPTKATRCSSLPGFWKIARRRHQERPFRNSAPGGRVLLACSSTTAC